MNVSASSAAAPPDNLTTEATELEAPLSEEVGPEGSEACAVPLTKKPRVDIGAIENLGEASVRTLTRKCLYKFGGKPDVDLAEIFCKSPLTASARNFSLSPG